jgi:hypothetical protein
MINVDVAIFETENCMGLGFVIRNHRGDFLAAVRQGFEDSLGDALNMTTC